MNLNQDVFLELFSLAITETSIPDAIDKKMVIDSLLIFTDIVNRQLINDPILDSPETRHLLSLLKQLIDEEHTFSDVQRLTIIVSKYIASNPDKKDKFFSTFLNSVLLAKEDLNEIKFERLYKKLRNIIATDKIIKETNIIQTKVKKLKTAPDLLTQEVLINDILQKGKMLTEDLGVLTKPVTNSTAEFIDFSNKESIIEALRINRLTRATSKFRTGLIGLNELLDVELELGESLLIGGITHNYKSGILMDFGRWIADNEPPKLDHLQPAILYITLENEAYKNLLTWFKRSYYITNGELPDPKATDEEIAAFIKDYFTKRGWSFHIVRKIGDFFGVPELFKLLDEYKKNGLRVYNLIIDYFALMKVGDSGSVTNSLGTRAVQIAAAYRQVMNLCKAENILFITVGQLNDEASTLVNHSINPVKKFSYHNHFSTSKALGQEADAIFFVHKEINSMKQAFLTMQWAKRRGKNPPLPDKAYCAYPFMGEIGILDDLYTGKPGFIRDIYDIVECNKLFNLDGDRKEADFSIFG